MPDVGHDPMVIRRSFGVGYINSRPATIGGVECALDPTSGTTKCTKNGNVWVLSNNMKWKRPKWGGKTYSMTLPRYSHLH